MEVDRSDRGWDPIGDALAKQDDLTAPEREILYRAISQRGFNALLLGPILGTRMQKGELDSDIPFVLAAYNDLRELKHAADHWRVLREDLGKVEKIAIRLFGVPTALKDLYGDGPLEGFPPEDFASDAFRFVDRGVWFIGEVVERAAHTLAEADCKYNREKDYLETTPGPSGGRPGRFLRVLVKEILLETGDNGNGADVRETIARELAPFYSAEELDTSKGKPLDKAVDNVLESR